jgi:hypothetical protein
MHIFELRDENVRLQAEIIRLRAEVDGLRHRSPAPTQISYEDDRAEWPTTYVGEDINIPAVLAREIVAYARRSYHAYGMNWRLLPRQGTTPSGVDRISASHVLDAGLRDAERWRVPPQPRPNAWMGDMREETLAFVSAHLGVTASEMAGAFGLTTAACRRHLDKLATSGDLFKVGRGYASRTERPMS